MKKSLKELSLKKSMISNLQSKTTKGGWHASAMCNPNQGSLFCPTVGALNSCPPPGGYCL